MHSAAKLAFLEGLLDLNEHANPVSLLPAAIRLLLGVLGAERGYIEVRDERDDAPFVWHASRACEGREEVLRARISRGVLAEALAHGKTLQSTSAHDDPRFATMKSVREHRLEAVLCAPVIGERVRGAVYVEGRAAPGPFSADDERSIERLARVIASRTDALCDRLDREERGARTLPGIVAVSDIMRRTVARVVACAGLDVAVLISGPTGTGKTMVARALHAASRRRAAPFVEINCATLPEALVESELFGAARGAHSATAHGSVDGKITAAEGGTLFLDEVGDLPYAAQAKLLTFLESKQYHRLGDTKAHTADVRILAASHVDLERAVEERRMREDLYYRLRVVDIHVPGLAERPEDIPPLARVLCERIRARHGVERLSLSPRALLALQAGSWPGNVRQLENGIERGAIAATMESRHEIQPEDIFGADEGERKTTLESMLHEHRGRLVRAALEDSGWNVSEAATQLDVARSQLYKLIGAHGLSRGAR